MLEFVFFNAQPRERFTDFVRARGLDVGESKDGDTYVVAIPEDIEDPVLDDIEAFYDEMMALDREIFEGAGDADAHAHQAAGVVLNLASGEAVYARVDPVLLGRIMEVLTPQEFGEVVNAIVDAVEHPDGRPLCQRTDDTA